MISVEGVPQLRAALEGYSQRVDAATADAIRVTALAVQADAIKSIQRGPKTGRRYKRRAREHQASAPGEAPATDTGRLASRVEAIIRKDYALVGTDIKYGGYLEFGTREIQARPWLRPARRKNLALLRARLVQGLTT